tara:strand:+ start:2294 stop:3091 length:798 start_codon:yes stop_codon:yes gene_type:complete
MVTSGLLEKMSHEDGDPIRYFLMLDGKPVEVTSKVGKRLTLSFLGVINCVECDREIKKTYNDGYCYPCFRDLPENALCGVKPELCEHEYGNKKDQGFFKKYCNVDHLVYLSLTSGVKVGVTRYYNIPSRWIDQGAVLGLVIARTSQRKYAGQIEVALARQMPDKTNWRKMLKGDIADADLKAVRDTVLGLFPRDLRSYALEDEEVRTMKYPLLSTPEKITSHNLDKEPEFTDTLTGIKGQYLIFEKRVINLRKYSGYRVKFNFED